jgi:hypothetical protein
MASGIVHSKPNGSLDYLPLEEVRIHAFVVDGTFLINHDLFSSASDDNTSLRQCPHESRFDKPF